MSKRLTAGPFVVAKESGKLAPGLLTMSGYLADIVPGCWAIEWAATDDAERRARTQQFGITAAQLTDVIRWVTDHFDGGFVWPNLFLDGAIAREFCRRFITVTVRLLQMSLPEKLLEHFLALTAPPPQQLGYAPVGHVGVHQALARRLTLLELEGRRGFEVLGFDGAAGFDSFRCNGLEKDFEQRFGIHFNEWGLIDDARDAARCTEFANSPEVSTCAVAWHPWLVTEHGI